MPCLNFFVSFFFQEKKEKEKTETSLNAKKLFKLNGLSPKNNPAVLALIL